MNHSHSDYEFSHLTTESFVVKEGEAEGSSSKSLSAGVKQMKTEVATSLNEFLSTHLSGETITSLENKFLCDPLHNSGHHGSHPPSGEGRTTTTQISRGHQVLNSLWSSINDSLTDNKIEANKKDELDRCDVYSYKPDALQNGDCPLTEGNPLWSFNYFIVSRTNNKMIYFHCQCQTKETHTEENENDIEGLSLSADVDSTTHNRLLESSFEINRQRLYEMDANDVDSPNSATGFSCF